MTWRAVGTGAGLIHHNARSGEGQLGHHDLIFVHASKNVGEPSDPRRDFCPDGEANWSRRRVVQVLRKQAWRMKHPISRGTEVLNFIASQSGIPGEPPHARGENVVGIRMSLQCFKMKVQLFRFKNIIVIEKCHNI